ncbi:hypothetical protein M758_6G105900 [Ceratodon purpureus]|nr:hypothetical protein M758_6G105900 [Ceratodon purpureus]
MSVSVSRLAKRHYRRGRNPGCGRGATRGCGQWQSWNGENEGGVKTGGDDGGRTCTILRDAEAGLEVHSLFRSLLLCCSESLPFSGLRERDPSAMQCGLGLAWGGVCRGRHIRAGMGWAGPWELALGLYCTARNGGATGCTVAPGFSGM